MNKKYFSRAHFWAQLHIAMLALILTALFIATGHALTGLLCLTLIGVVLNRPKARLCAVTLSAPEIARDILDAFKTELPEAFQPGGIATDFSSKTAKLGDSITAHISKVPPTQAYVAGSGGFQNNAADVTTLIQDVPCILNQLRHVPVKIGWLSSIAAKGVPLYKAAIGNLGFALAKYVIDQFLTSALVSFSNTVFVGQPILTNLETYDQQIRTQLNSQKVYAAGRWAIINSALAANLGLDDRVRSNLFYGQRNPSEGIRVWRNLAGFNWIREYVDYPASQIGGVAGDRRACVFAVRKIEEASHVADDLGIPKVMEFYPIKDETTGLEMTGLGWQEAGTGDYYVSAAILFGLGIGNQGGTPGSLNDSAGVLLRTN